MSSLFEELGLLDRPFVTFETEFHGKKVFLRARALSGQESDELEALQMDEYARTLTKLTEHVDGATSELERVRGVYTAAQKRDVVTQLLSARSNEIMQAAVAKIGLDFRKEAAYMETLEEEERETYAQMKNEELEDAKKEASENLRAELEAREIEILADELSQVTINLRAQRIANRAFSDLFLYYSVYMPQNDVKFFPSRKAVAEALKAETISALVGQVREALKTDVPFESPAADEPVKPSSSPSTSEEATADSGTLTETITEG